MRSFTTAAFAGYYPKDGQYWLKMAGLTNVLIFHTKQRYATSNGSRSAVAEYRLPMTPTCFGSFGDTFIIGATDGYLYSIVNEAFDATSTEIAPIMKTAILQIPNEFKESQITGIEYFIDASNGASLTIDVYRNGAATTKVHTETVTIPTSDANLLNFPFYIDTNFNARAVQIGISGVDMTAGRLTIEGFAIKHRRT
jgi:hypothetical protein